MFTLLQLASTNYVTSKLQEIRNECHYCGNMYYISMLLLFLLDLSFGVTEQGNACTLNIEGEEGMCKLISDCPYAQDLLQRKIYPETCGFIGRNPIVCCKSKHSQGSSLAAEASTTSISVDCDGCSTTHQNSEIISVKNPGELTMEKCLEYYPEPEYPILGVAGGEQSLSKEFPHMAAIGYGDVNNIQWECGGSLISKKFVLTAAHCFDDKSYPAKYVLLGDLDLATDEDDALPQNFTIIRTILHPSYKSPAKYHDIALIELDRNAQFNEYVSPACLITKIESIQSNLTATGWGKTGFADSSSSFLLKVNLDHVPHKECLGRYGKLPKQHLPNGLIEDFQICAGMVKNKDTCQGDSGGPLQYKNEERTFDVNVHNVVGVTSFGKACGLSGSPGIYTRISNYIPWIESIAWENEKLK